MNVTNDQLIISINTKMMTSKASIEFGKIKLNLKVKSDIIISESNLIKVKDTACRRQLQSISSNSNDYSIKFKENKDNSRKNTIQIRSMLWINRIKRHSKSTNSSKFHFKEYPKKIILFKELFKNDLIKNDNRNKLNGSQNQFENNSKYEREICQNNKINLLENFNFNLLEWSNLGFLALASLHSVYIFIDDEKSTYNGKLSRVFSIDNLKEDNNSNKTLIDTQFIDVTNSFNNKPKFSFNDYYDLSNDIKTNTIKNEIFIKKIKFNCIGDKLLILLSNEAIHILDLTNQKVEQIFLSKFTKIIDISFNNINFNYINFLAIDVNKSKLINYDLRQKDISETNLNGFYNCFKISNDDSFIALGDVKGNLHLKDSKCEKLVKIDNNNTDKPISFISIKNDNIITSHGTDKINFLNSSLHKNINSLSFKHNKIEKAEILTDNRILISGINDIEICDEKDVNLLNNSYEMNTTLKRKKNDKPFIYSFDLSNQKIIEQFSFIPEKEDVEQKMTNEENDIDTDEKLFHPTIDIYDKKYIEKENDHFIKHQNYYTFNCNFSSLYNPNSRTNTDLRTSRYNLDLDFDFGNDNEEYQSIFNSSFSLKEKKLAVLSSKTNSFYLWNIKESLKAL